MKITRDDDFGGAVLNCAVRYALGRASYMPGLVMGEITQMLQDCSDKTLWCLDRDVSEWLERTKPETGFFVNYYDEWQRFLEAVRAEMERRRGE